jgi:hypothetical protein
MWYREALYGLGVWGDGVLLILGGVFSANCGSSVTSQFLIYGAHSVCFLPLVTILDPHTNPLFCAVSYLTKPGLSEIHFFFGSTVV